VLMLGIFTPEMLCFLSPHEEDRMSFRKLSVLTNLIEDAPTLVLQIVFLYRHGWVRACAALCYAMLCFPCYAMLGHAMPCYAVLCYGRWR
jgi:hypothetical protein